MLIMTSDLPSDFRLYCVYTKDNYTVEVDIGKNYTGVLGDQVLTCSECHMGGMPCYTTPLR